MFCVWFVLCCRNSAFGLMLKFIGCMNCGSVLFSVIVSGLALFIGGIISVIACCMRLLLSELYAWFTISVSSSFELFCSAGVFNF